MLVYSSCMRRCTLIFSVVTFCSLARKCVVTVHGKAQYEVTVAMHHYMENDKEVLSFTKYIII